MTRYIEIKPYKDYGWMDLPKDAIIENIEFDKSVERLKVYYKSESGKIHCSNGECGYEYHTFRENEDIKIVISMQCEVRQVVYSKVVDYNGQNLFIVIVTWNKR